MEAAVAVGEGKAVDPFGGGGEHDAVAVVAGADGQADGEVGLAGAGRARKTTLSFGGDEVEGGEVGDDVAFQRALVVPVELVEALAGGEAAARMRSSPPLAATSRSRQAARNSSWVQPSLRARSASRSTAAAIEGAFNARHR